MAGTALPIPDYDQLPLGDLETRIRSLDEESLEVLLDHERGHADRPAVLQVLARRRDEVRRGAPLSGGDPTSAAGPAPAQGPPDPASPQTEGPPQNPPSHGVPTNPAQPRG